MTTKTPPTSNSNQANDGNYRDEPYLRAEHLLVNRRYVATEKVISRIVRNCPKKKMGAKGEDSVARMLGLGFKGTDKILGLCATNESMVAHIMGDGDPEKWVGRPIKLVVRLVGNKNKEPAIRVWPGRGNQHPNQRVRVQMGEEITEEWYKDHVYQTEPTQDKKQPDQDKKPSDQKPFGPAERQGLIDKLKAQIASADTAEKVAKERTNFGNLIPYLSGHNCPLTPEEQKMIEDMLAQAEKSIK